MSTVVYASAILLHVMGAFRCQDTATIALSSNPAYSGELIVLTCRFGEDNTLSFVTIDAFNHTRKEGTFWCRVPRPNVTAYGVLRGNVMSGCPNAVAESPGVVNLSMTASPSLELDFNCTTIVTNVDTRQYRLTSVATSLVVYVLPSAPKFEPNPLVFNEGDTANVVCESHDGKPASSVVLTVSSLSGSRLATTGIGSASLSLSPPLNHWHNATATCNVTNHNFLNMTTSSNIKINHISCASGPDVDVLDSENAALDCSKYISSYPVPNYTWSVWPKIDAANLKSLVEFRVSTIVQIKSVTFNCTAINGVVRQAATVLIIVNDSGHFSSTQKELGFQLSKQCSVTSMPLAESFYGDGKPSEIHEIVYVRVVISVIAAIVAILASLVIYRKRKVVCAMRERHMAMMKKTLPKSNIFTDDAREMTSMVDNDLYSHSSTYHSNEAEQHLCVRKATTVEDSQNDISEPLPVASCDTGEHHYEDLVFGSSTLKHYPSTSTDVLAEGKVVSEPDEKDLTKMKAISPRLDIL